MNIEVRKDKKVAVDMIDQIRKIIDNFSEKIEGYVTSPAGKNLFTVRDGPEYFLDDKRKEELHSVVAALLYIVKRALPDIEPVIAFLCSQVTRGIFLQIGGSWLEF